MRLLETMRADDGAIALLDLHLGRLAGSAEAFGWEVDVEVVRQRVEAAEVGRGPWGVRLTVGDATDVEIRSWQLEDEPMQTAWIDPEPFPQAGTRLCVHKTTDRAHYRRRYERALSHGADETVLVTPSGVVSEGTRTTVWAQVDGKWLTPPLADGGLAGVMRAHLLATRGECAVASLPPAALAEADGVALSNALRGWMPVRVLNSAHPQQVHPAPSPDPPSQ